MFLRDFNQCWLACWLTLLHGQRGWRVTQKSLACKESGEREKGETKKNCRSVSYYLALEKMQYEIFPYPISS